MYIIHIVHKHKHYFLTPGLLDQGDQVCLIRVAVKISVEQLLTQFRISKPETGWAIMARVTNNIRILIILKLCSLEYSLGRCKNHIHIHTGQICKKCIRAIKKVCHIWLVKFNKFINMFIDIFNSHNLLEKF